MFCEKKEAHHESLQSCGLDCNSVYKNGARPVILHLSMQCYATSNESIDWGHSYDLINIDFNEVRVGD